MMTGTIEKGVHPRLLITLATDKGQVNLKALVDSGFDGQVALHTMNFVDNTLTIALPNE